MTTFDYWRLCDHISVFQALMLMLDREPKDMNHFDVERDSSEQPEAYWIIKTALVNAIRCGQIEADIVKELECNEYGMESLIEDPHSVNIDKTLINTKSLKEYLKNRGLNSGFFFPDGAGADDFLDPDNLRYAPKLAAAISAWKAVSKDQNLLNGKTPKQALEIWLRDNAEKYRLTKDDGSPNETGIEEICKIANWKPEGGAAKTPSRVTANPPSPKKAKEAKKSG